jgi:ABC-type nitrate/sulfonate/bicarbonate transport system permease component
VPETHAVDPPGSGRAGSAVVPGSDQGTLGPEASGRSAHLRQLATWNRARIVAGYCLGLVLGILAWQVIGKHSEQQIFVPLTDTLTRLGELVADGTLAAAAANSFATYAVGILMALVVGALGGLVLARSEIVRTALEPYIMGLYAAPMVALIPFLLAFLGFGFWPKSIVVALFAVFPVLLNTQRGAQSIASELIDVARLYRSGEKDLWVHVIAPYTLPFFMTGVRQALARGLVGMIAADIFLSANGLGGMLITAAQFFDTAAMLATVLVITVCGVVLMAIGNFIERRFARWKVGQ